MVRLFAGWIALALLPAIEGCTLLRPLDGLTCEPGSGDAACPYGHECGADADCAAGSCRDKRCQCPDDMVMIESKFCIDRTEVSNGAYQRFVDSAPRVDQQASYCSFNTDFGFDVVTGPEVCRTRESDENYPATCIDWCDATAFCRSLGKHLCGHIGGGANPASALDDPAASEWFDACSRGGALDFPTGEYDSGSCNGAAQGPVPVSSGNGARCEGGYTGLVHMSGNIREWENSCSGETGPGDTCLTRGGAFDSLSPDATEFDEVRCDLLDPRRRDDTDFTIGFRCCR
jgi:sulfatase modifying factor 1